MEKRKLYFSFIRNFHFNIEIIADNHIDIENYLASKYNYSDIKTIFESNEMLFKKPNDSATYYADLKWLPYV